MSATMENKPLIGISCGCANGIGPSWNLTDSFTVCSYPECWWGMYGGVCRICFVWCYSFLEWPPSKCTIRFEKVKNVIARRSLCVFYKPAALPKSIPTGDSLVINFYRIRRPCHCNGRNSNLQRICIFRLVSSGQVNTFVINRISGELGCKVGFYEVKIWIVGSKIGFLLIL